MVKLDICGCLADFMHCDYFESFSLKRGIYMCLLWNRIEFTNDLMLDVFVYEIESEEMVLLYSLKR